MLKEVFSECYENENDAEKNYKKADEKYLKLSPKYGLGDKDEKYFNRFKSNKGFGTYDFSEKEIQFLKFLKEIDNIMNIKKIDRVNAANKNLTLENFNSVADVVKKVIDDNKYPAITDDLRSTLGTPEFLSLYSLHDLVKEITMLFQYICQNKYADYNIYGQAMEYINTLLYTYVGYTYYSKFMSEMLGEKTPHGYENKIEINDITVYKGVKEYVKKVFDAVTLGDGRSNSVEANLTQGNYHYVFEFDSIEEITDFIGEYCKYSDMSHKFKKCCDHNLIHKEIISNKEISVKYTECASSPYLCNKIMNEMTNHLHIEKSEKQKLINDLNEKIKFDIEGIQKYTKFDGGVRDNLKKACKELRKAQDNFINKYMYTYGNGKLLRAIGFTNTLKEEVFALIKTPSNDFEFEIVETLFYDGFILPFSNSIQNTLGFNTIEYQLSYKTFKIQLSNIDMIKNKNISNKDIVNKDIAKGISDVLRNIDNQIINDFENDNKLFSAISNAVGIYLNEIFEKARMNESKKNGK